MKRKTMLLISSFICSSLLTNEGKCSGIMSKKMLESLHQKSKIVQRKAVKVDWKGNRVFLQEDQVEGKIGNKLLDSKDLEELKKKSFIPPRRNVVKIDPDSDVISYEKKEK